MPLSQTGLQQVLSESVSKVFLQCLRISHSEITTLRLVNDKQDLTRSDGTYNMFPFDVAAFPGSDNRPPSLEITTDMVDQRLMEVVRQLSGKRERPIIEFEMVLADSPDTVEYGPLKFLYDSAKTDSKTSLTISASFLTGALNDAFPALQFAPSNASE